MTDTNLYQANAQWASRPPDERMESIEEFEAKAIAIKERSRTSQAVLSQITVENTDDNGIELVGANGNRAVPTNYAFSQLCNRLSYPSSALRGDLVSAKIAADVLNYRIERLEDQEKSVDLLLQPLAEGTWECRSITSERYGRYWNVDLVPFMRRMQDLGFRVPPARPALPGQPGTRKATEEDCLKGNDFGLSVKPGDLIAPAGLYLSDRDMFAIMVNTENKIDDGTGRMLSQGFFLSNSEVGDGSLQIVEYLFAMVCQNHIIWSANNVVTTKYRHIGDIYPRVNKCLDDAVGHLESRQLSEVSNDFNRLRRFEIAPNQIDTVETLYEMRIDSKLTKKVLNEAYDFGEQFGEIDGAKPNTPLGIVHGLTRYTQTLPFASDKSSLEEVGGKILRKFHKVLS